MSKPVTIPKNVNTKNDLDFEFLRKEGLAYIEKLGSKLWTDYNTHDPGITVLEMLCYAITDLSQRIEMPIENLLASDTDNFKNMHQQFLSAINILPSKPVTALDYRKLFVHLKEVKNAWIVKHNRNVYVNCKNHKMAYTAFEVDAKHQKEFALKGLNDIYVDFEDTIAEKDKEAVLKKVKRLYHKNRNLCEDLVNVYPIPEHHISVCAYIDIASEADEEYIQASIIKELEEYLAPSVSFYSLNQMYDKGYATDEIFQGPVPFSGGCIEPEDFQGGFVDYDELRAASLRTEIRLSDIIKIIMSVEGVLTIKDISIKSCDDGTSNSDKWLICVPENYKPVLCWNTDKLSKSVTKNCGSSMFNFTKVFLPIGVNKTRVLKILKELKAEEKQELAEIKTEDVSFPVGKYSHPSQYTTIQNDFPETYGISPNGLPPIASTERKAKANQFKAYLLFFDQVLANYFAHLSKVKDLLSVDDHLKKLYTVNAISELSAADKQTYFTQTLSDVTDIDSLLNSATYEKDLIGIVNDLKGSAANNEDHTYYERRNKFLDHLISRFAERFSDYVFIMKSIHGDTKAKHEILKAKTKFIEDYKEIGCERGMAFNYCNSEYWDTNNVSGVQKRISRLTGISDFSRRNLLNESVYIYKKESESEDGTLIEYGWRIKEGDTEILTSKNTFSEVRKAVRSLFLAFEYGTTQENYKLENPKAKEFYFNLINPEITDAKSSNYLLATKIAKATSKKLAEKKCKVLITYLNNINVYEEGIYLVEHILIRPDIYNMDAAANEDEQDDDTAADTDSENEVVPVANKTQIPDAPPDNFMPSCLDGDCETCGPLDPYSFRVSVILPGWTNRFSNKDFRTYMEKIIREELPAHVLGRICWVGHVKGAVPNAENDIIQMQLRYKMFLEQLHLKCENTPLNKDEIGNYRDKLRDFIKCLNGVNTIYHSGNLHDCDNDDTETDGNKIVLGRTNIGNL